MRLVTDKYVFPTTDYKQKHEDLVEEKIQFLYDFCILLAPKIERKRSRGKDPREERVRAMLMRCKTETEMMQKIRDARDGIKTIDEVLEANS